MKIYVFKQKYNYEAKKKKRKLILVKINDRNLTELYESKRKDMSFILNVIGRHTGFLVLSKQCNHK